MNTDAYNKKLRRAIDVLNLQEEEVSVDDTNTVRFCFEGVTYFISIDTFYMLLNIIDEYGKQPTPREFEEWHPCPKN